MKMIGLLGGTSWPSTFSYYEQLNQAAQSALGGHHSARILLYSIDYHPIKSLYHHGWDQIPTLLHQEITTLAGMKPDCIILCNNTLHFALDQIAESLKLSVPIFHAGHLAAEKAKQQGCKSVLLLGTSFTMENGFFARYFEQRDITVRTPTEEDRKIIQAIQSELAKGVMKPEYTETFRHMLDNYSDVDAIILACTELPLAINTQNAPKPLINPIHCQCKAAADFCFL